MIEFLLTLGGIWFWSIAVFFVVAIMFFVESEVYTPVIFLSFLAIGIFAWKGQGIEVAQYYIENPMIAIGHFGLYFILGSVFSIIKWYCYVRSERNKYDDDKAEFLRNHGAKTLDDIPTAGMKHTKDSLRTMWQNRIGSYETFLSRLSPSNHKQKMSYWIAYWPFSAIATFINEPITKIVKFILRNLGGVYDKIVQSNVKGLEDDFKKK
jgi:hypothetical protein